MIRTKPDFYRDAGMVRTSGRGLALSLAGASYFIMPEDVHELLQEHPGDIVDAVGEKEGVAWLSPLTQQKKREMTLLIRNRIYSVDISHLVRLLAEKQRSAKIREYVRVLT